MEQIRILHVLNHTYRLSGNVHAAVDLACAQAAQGHDVTVCSRGGSFDEVLRNNGVSLLTIDPGRRPVAVASGAWKLLRWCRETSPDVVHAHMMTSAIMAWPVCRALRIPLVTTVHNSFQTAARLMGLGDRVIAVSESVESSMVRRGISKRRMRTVLNGTIGSARLPSPGPETEVLSHPAIVFVGGLHPRKGVGTLIKAFGLVSSRHPDARLYLIGEGPNRAEYEQLCNELGLDGEQVCFVGSLSDPRGYLRAADIFILPSTSDPAPLVISEAREAGCAIIATEVDGIPELLDDGKAGILVPPNDPERLAAAMDRLLRDPAELRQYRKRSSANLGALTVSRVASDTTRVYRECFRTPDRVASSTLQ